MPMPARCSAVAPCDGPAVMVFARSGYESVRLHAVLLYATGGSLLPQPILRPRALLLCVLAARARGAHRRALVALPATRCCAASRCRRRIDAASFTGSVWPARAGARRRRRAAPREARAAGSGSWARRSPVSATQRRSRTRTCRSAPAPRADPLRRVAGHDASVARSPPQPPAARVWVGVIVAVADWSSSPAPAALPPTLCRRGDAVAGVCLGLYTLRGPRQQFDRGQHRGELLRSVPVCGRHRRRPRGGPRNSRHRGRRRARRSSALSPPASATPSVRRPARPHATRPLSCLQLLGPGPRRRRRRRAARRGDHRPSGRRRRGHPRRGRGRRHRAAHVPDTGS